MQRQQHGLPGQATSQGQLDLQNDGVRLTQTEGDIASGSVPDGNDEVALNRFSLKLEDMSSNGKLNRTGGWRTSFGRSGPPKARTVRAPLQKTYSQYNLTELGNAVVDESRHKPRK